MAAVAVAAHALVDGLSWPAAFMLGAVVAPTDAVAAVATFASVRVPRRVRLLVQGESLINDATGLTAFRVAVAAAGAEGFSWAGAFGEFVLAAAGGAVIGIAVGWVILRAIRRLPDVTVSVLITVLAAYASYIAAEEVHASGILAAAVCGLYSGWHQSEYFDADTRLTAGAFWRILVFGLEALLFVLLGLQLESVVDQVGEGEVGRLAAIGVALAAIVIAVRVVFAALPLAPGLSRRERLVVGWCGMRGAISLAAALSIAHRHPRPLRGDLPHVRRDPGDARRPGADAPGADQDAEAPERPRVEPGGGGRPLEAAQTALDRLDELEQDERISEEALRRLRDLYQARFRQCMAVLGGEKAPDVLAGAADALRRRPPRPHPGRARRDPDPAQRRQGQSGRAAADRARSRPGGGAAALISRRR